MTPPQVSNVSQLKPWRSRYVFLPRPDFYFQDHNVNTLLLKEKLITVHFYNILFAINSIKPQVSRAGSLMRFQKANKRHISIVVQYKTLSKIDINSKICDSASTALTALTVSSLQVSALHGPLLIGYYLVVLLKILNELLIDI